MKPFIFIRTFIAAIFLLIPSQSIFGQQTFIDNDDKGREVACNGYYSLTTDGINKLIFHGSKWTLRDKYNNSAILDFSEKEWNDARSELSLYTCVDIDNDGLKEAVVEYYTGGAHCCHEYYIYKETSGLKLLDSISLGDAGNPVFRDINNDGILELLTLNNSFAYFDSLCFACSPFLPLILCYHENRFEDCTANYHSVIDTEIKKALVREGDIQGSALGYLALHIIKGQESEGWEGIKKYYPSIYTWLKEHEKDIKKKLSSEEFAKRKGIISFKTN